MVRICLGAFFKHVFSPNGWQKNSQNCKIQKCSDLIHCPMVLPISICKFDVKNTPQMYSNTSPTCFEGPRGRKMKFRGPGEEIRVWVLLNYVHHQYVYMAVSPLFPYPNTVT